MAYATRRPTFWIKAILLVGLVAISDWALFDASGFGANIGVVALAWTVGVAIATPAVLRSHLGRRALLAAALFALLQFERPTFVGLVLFAVALGVAALSPRAPEVDDAWRWLQRLFLAALKTLWGPFLDLGKLRRARGRRSGLKVAKVVLAGLLPVLGGLLFIWLFSLANPVISEALGGYEFAPVDFARIFFWLVFAFPVIAALRPRSSRRLLRLPEAAGDVDLPGVTATSITVSLVAFNAIFAVQNGLDVAFLWSGARLPGDLTFAEYAHRGAFPLIATAILAGLFVLVLLRPGSATATARLVRPLVILWLAQNLFLVASTALRTLDYVDAYSLTEMRIAALMWMILVATGLGLVLCRLITGKSASWLVNANALTAGLVLTLCSVIDLSAVAAAWNVRHAREVGGRGVALDVCYLGGMHGASLVSLAELERRSVPPDLRDRVAWKRQRIVDEVSKGQATWRGWRWRDARRLERVAKLPEAEPLAAPYGRECDGRIIAPPPPPKPALPLTPKANPGT